jgi:hypothetical protein
MFESSILSKLQSNWHSLQIEKKVTKVLLYFKFSLSLMYQPYEKWSFQNIYMSSLHLELFHFSFAWISTQHTSQDIYHRGNHFLLLPVEITFSLEAAIIMPNHEENSNINYYSNRWLKKNISNLTFETLENDIQTNQLKFSFAISDLWLLKMINIILLLPIKILDINFLFK